MGAIAPNLKAAAAGVHQMGLGDRRRLQTQTSLAGMLEGLPAMRDVSTGPLAGRQTVSGAVAVCPRDYVLVVRDAPGRRERPVRLV